RDVLAASPREIDVVLRVIPGALELGLEVRAARNEQQRVRGKERRDRAALAFRGLVPYLAVDRKHERAIDDAAGTLRHEIEMAQVFDLVAPEFGAHGLGHPERVHVEDATPDRELRDVLDERDALESDPLEVIGQLAQPVAVPLLELDAEVAQ